MVPYTELKSPPPPPNDSLVQDLDRKAAYLDLDGVPRRSSHVTHRMLQRGVPVSKAASFTLGERAHPFLEIRGQDTLKTSATALKFAEEAAREEEANVELKVECETHEKRWEQSDTQYAKERLAFVHEFQQRKGHARTSLVATTERNTTQLASRTSTYIDAEGNFRRRSSTAVDPSLWGGQEATDAFFLGPATPPAPEKRFIPEEYI